MAPVFKKLLKTLSWMVFIGVLIFLMIVSLIQIPSIQTKIVQYATNFVSNKTHTKVEIKNINISFPKSVVIEGIYLEDIKNDTLIYAKKAKVNIALYELLKRKIAINSIAIENTNINLYSTKNDSLFNYNFLLTAFVDTTEQAKTISQTSHQWTFSLDNINLKNIRVRYDDQYGGIDVSTKLKNLELGIDNLDLEKSIYNINNLLVENMRTTIHIGNLPVLSKIDSPILPAENKLKISVKKIELKKNSIDYRIGDKKELKNQFNADHLTH